MVPNHVTQYEENPFSHHGGMHEDGHADRQLDGLTNGPTDRLDPFLYSLILLRWRGNNKPPTVQTMCSQSPEFSQANNRHYDSTMLLSLVALRILERQTCSS